MDNTPANQFKGLEATAPCLGQAVYACAHPEDLDGLTARWADRNAIAKVFIALQGDLGAGKTTVVRSLLRQLGYQGRVKSPTYTLLESYPLPAHTATQRPAFEAYHFDLYRFNDPEEWDDAGFRDIFASDGLKLVEWPDKAAHWLPRPDVVVFIDTRPDEGRELRVKAMTTLGLELLA